MKSNIRGVVFKEINEFDDDRGWLVELFRRDELAQEHFPVMSYISMTKSDVIRGPHMHHSQTDNFCFISAEFELHLWLGSHHEKFILGENNKRSVIIPPMVVHAYKNISDKDGFVLNFPNKLFKGPGKRYPVDEVRYEDQIGTIYKI